MLSYDHADSMYAEVAAAGCLVWYGVVNLVSALGTIQIFRHFSKPPSDAVSSKLPEDVVPHVTIIRPCTGIEPYLYECLAASFYQEYPWSKLTICFCVSSKSDAAYPILVRLKQHYQSFDVRIYIEDEDPYLQAVDIGPNPKIRNLSRAYREAKGDIVWILDCNIWVSRGACGRVVDKLCGFTSVKASAVSSSNNTTDKNSSPTTSWDQLLELQQERPYKLVAHLPVVVSVDNIPRSIMATYTKNPSEPSHRISGSLLEQSFLSSAHAKFYIAINTVAIAPCINGKSTAFRRPHLDMLTEGKGTDYFGENICEDHLIGDLLWRSNIPSNEEEITLLGRSHGQSDGDIRATNDDKLQAMQEKVRNTNPRRLRYRNHGLAINDLALQPISAMTMSIYFARRVRWLRVRKFIVFAATLVEPGTESFVCSAMGAWALTTSSYTRDVFGQSWRDTLMWWCLSVMAWSVVDYFVFGVLQSGDSIEALPSSGSNSSENNEINKKDNISGTKDISKPVYSVALPPFVKPYPRTLKFSNSSWLPFTTWLGAWLGREILAFPIWAWAMLCGTTVVWHDKKFWTGFDGKVHAIRNDGDGNRNGATVKKD